MKNTSDQPERADIQFFNQLLAHPRALVRDTSYAVPT